MITRRKLLAGVSTGLVGGSLSGCLSSNDNKSETADSKTGTSAGSPSQTTDTSTSTTIPPWTEVPTETNSGRDIPALELQNHTGTDQSLTVTVGPDDGEQITDTWTVEPEYDIEIDTYESLDSDATITATVEGYEPATSDWAGRESGESLVVIIKEDEIELLSLIT